MYVPVTGGYVSVALNPMEGSIRLTLFDQRFGSRSTMDSGANTHPLPEGPILFKH